MTDRETTIVETGDGGAAAILTGVLTVALLVVGVFFYFSISNGGSKTIDIDVPKITVDVTPNGQ